MQQVFCCPFGLHAISTIALERQEYISKTVKMEMDVNMRSIILHENTNGLNIFPLGIVYAAWPKHDDCAAKLIRTSLQSD